MRGGASRSFVLSLFEKRKEQKEKTLQEMDVLVKKRKWKNRLGIVAVTAIVIAIAAVSLGSYIRTRQTAINNSMEGMYS